VNAVWSEVDVFVDCHNLWDPWPCDLLSLETQLDDLFRGIQLVAGHCLSKPADVRLRLYDGWRDDYGRATQRALLLEYVLPAFRGLRDQLRFLPSIAETVIGSELGPLSGTFRFVPPPPHQKMVDVALASDLIILASQEGGPLLVISDDDDFVPALLAAAAMGKRRLILARRRHVGRALNDAQLFRAGIQVSGRY
jgi:hypothetical protein